MREFTGFCCNSNNKYRVTRVSSYTCISLYNSYMVEHQAMIGQVYIADSSSVGRSCNECPIKCFLTVMHVDWTLPNLHMISSSSKASCVHAIPCTDQIPCTFLGEGIGRNVNVLNSNVSHGANSLAAHVRRGPYSAYYPYVLHICQTTTIVRG